MLPNPEVAENVLTGTGYSAAVDVSGTVRLVQMYY